VWVKNSPKDEQDGVDRELQAAIDEVMRMLQEARPRAADQDR
jgi:hypothetical protein